MCINADLCIVLYTNPGEKGINEIFTYASTHFHSFLVLLLAIRGNVLFMKLLHVLLVPESIKSTKLKEIFKWKNRRGMKKNVSPLRKENSLEGEICIFYV